jgi:hypothetical protein
LRIGDDARDHQAAELPLSFLVDCRGFHPPRLTPGAAGSVERLQVGEELDGGHARRLVVPGQRSLDRALHEVMVERAQGLDQPLALRRGEICCHPSPTRLAAGAAEFAHVLPARVSRAETVETDDGRLTRLATLVLRLAVVRPGEESLCLDRAMQCPLGSLAASRKAA